MRSAGARFRRHRGALVGVLVLVLVTMAVLLGPALLDRPPERQDLALGPTAPSFAHPFGTDYEGRDLLARVLAGGRISLLVGLVATLVSLVIGVVWGAVAGFVGGRLDRLMMRIVDVLYGLPYMFFVIILMVWFGRSLVNVFIGLGAISWLTMARIVRAEVAGLAGRDFVLASRLAGVSPLGALLRHVLPNAAGPIIVYGTLTVPRVMIEESFLSFLGLGVQPPAASWGSLLAEGASLFREYPWLLFFPALLLSATLLALNFVGDGLRESFDPGEARR
ncbi:MAG: ABC transporter permease [Planctomycetes bacterium]|nr:ABC transporter permease [Planctomycetota bacterium]